MDSCSSDRAVLREPEAAVRDRAQAPKERPILFNGPMVRAVLDGSKTQTRRALRGFCPPNRPEYDSESGRLEWFNGDEVVVGRNCPYGAPGDRLWVRETWRRDIFDHTKTLYRASHGDRTVFDKWCPSIHMHRARSRITLEVTGVRVERLHDISEADARAEGIVPFGDGNGWHTEDGRHYAGSAAAAYLNLWSDINGTASAEANPWVWALSFRKTASGCSHTARSDDQSKVDDQEPTANRSNA